ncbi:hypothetical protein GCM10027589_00260 [Actinocorallia lasiicapitis]
MRFTLRFHVPFRVSTGAASDGLDTTFDPVNPLPASSLKGIMRANANTILKLDKALCDEVFGSVSGRSPWWWSDATLAETTAATRTRLSIDPSTGTASDGALVTGAELWAATGWFELLDRDRIDPERLDLHQTVLTASALAITSLGSNRRRGLGWVSVDAEQPWTKDQQELLRAHRRLDA